MKVKVITLGCSKNLVDSEVLMGMFDAAGIECAENAPIVVINTCGFIKDAKEESINTILECANEKTEGSIEQLYVMGCLSERYREELAQEIPEVDKFFGKFDWKELVEYLRESGNQGTEELGRFQSNRRVTTPSHYAYLKISEGCDRKCAYCAIPIMTGNHVSRPIEEILEEVRHLAQKGVKELQVIAQELTYYGVDLNGKQQIAELIERISEVDGIEWIRLHYAYPTKFPMELLRVIKENKKVCKYLDIAFQHISDNMLEKMQRHFTSKETYELISKIREEVPGIHLRTTLMVGFPGETEKDFDELMYFVKKARFERMGAFTYSEEEGTYAAEHYKDNIPERIKQERLDKLMALQQEIAEEIAAEKVGTIIKIIIDRREGDYYVGRTEYSSPEIDPEVLISADEGQMTIGKFYDVEITDSTEFDLYGKQR